MKAAVVCSKGVGDGLLMMVASHRLFSRGYRVTTYHDLLPQMDEWFPDHYLKKRESLIPLEKGLNRYDLILLQYEETPFAREIIDLYRKGHLHNLSVFYSKYEKKKHPKLTSWDRVFDQSKSMVDNIAEAVASLLQCTQVSKNNGLVVPRDLKQSRYSKRVVIHPTSAPSMRTSKSRRWIKLAHLFAKKGYEASFITRSKLSSSSTLGLSNSFKLHSLTTLKQIAAYIYESIFFIDGESGMAHLASNLHIPTLIVGSCRRQANLWQPGWFTGSVVTPSPLFFFFTKLCLLKKRWQYDAPPKQILHTFESIRKGKRH